MRLGETHLAQRLEGLLPRLRLLLATEPESIGAARLDAAQADRLLARLRCAVSHSRGQGAFINVWAVAGLKRHEVRTCAVLAWFLDPLGSHGGGAAYLEACAPLIPSLAGADLAAARVATELRPQGSDEDRIDIALDLLDRAILLEAKIDAAPGDDQAPRYLRAATGLEKPGNVVWLAPAVPVNRQDGVDYLTWRQIGRALRTAEAPGLGQVLARQFADHIEAL